MPLATETTELENWDLGQACRIQNGEDCEACQ